MNKQLKYKEKNRRKLKHFHDIINIIIVTKYVTGKM